MKTFLIDHMEGCEPLFPCASCRAAKRIEERLGKEAYTLVVSIIKKEFERSYIPVDAKHKVPLETPLHELKLSRRIRTCLSHARLETVGEVLKAKDELFRLPNFGKTSFYELRVAFAEKGHVLDVVVPKVGKFV